MYVRMVVWELKGVCEDGSVGTYGVCEDGSVGT